MKTKIYLILFTAWTILATLNESDVLDLLPPNLEWLRLPIAVLVVIGGVFFIDPKEARDVVKRTVNPTPKPPKPPKK